MKCKFLFFVSLVIFLSCEQSSNDVIYKDGAQMLLLNHSEYLKNNPIFLEINDTIFENDSNLIKIYSLDNSIKIIGMYYNSGDCNYNDTLYIDTISFKIKNCNGLMNLDSDTIKFYLVFDKLLKEGVECFNKNYFFITKDLNSNFNIFNIEKCYYQSRKNNYN